MAGIDAGLTVAARDRPQSIAGWRPILGMTAAPAADATMMMAKAEAPARPPSVLTPTPEPSPRPPWGPAPKSRTGLWIALAVVLIAAPGRRRLLRDGHARAGSRDSQGAGGGRSGRRRKAQVPGGGAETPRRKGSRGAAQGRGGGRSSKAAQEASRGRGGAEGSRRLRRKIEAELAEKKKADDEAQQKAEAEAAAKRKAEDDARKAAELVAGMFDQFGKTLMLLGLAQQSRRDPPAGRRCRG